MRLARAHTGDGDAFPKQSYRTALWRLVSASLGGAACGGLCMLVMTVSVMVVESGGRVSPSGQLAMGALFMLAYSTLFACVYWVVLFFGALPILLFRERIVRARPPYVSRAYVGVAVLALAVTAAIVRPGWNTPPAFVLMMFIPPQVATYFTVRFFARMAAASGVR